MSHDLTFSCMVLENMYIINKHISNLSLGNGKPSTYNYAHMVLSHSPYLITGIIQHRFQAVFFFINNCLIKRANHQFHSLTENRDPAEKQK